MNKKAMILLMLGLTACAPTIQTSRVSVDEGDELSTTITDEWVKKDTELSINKLMEKMSKHKGLQRYISNSPKAPVLFVGEVQNDTSEPYLPIADLNERLLEKILEEGDFRVIDAEKRANILKEIQYQNDGMVDPAQAKKIGKQTGADVAIFGAIRMDPKTLAGKTIKEYSINLRITDLESGEVIWMGSYDISKYSKRSGSKW